MNAPVGGSDDGPSPLSLEELAADIATLYENAEGQAARVTSLQQAVHAIDSKLAELMRQTNNARVFRWEDLDEAEHDEKWAAFTTWVCVTSGRYSYDEIPGCPQWAEHTDLVEEFTALWVSWLGSYNAGADSNAPLRWHEALSRARDRVRDLRGGCTADAHHARIIRSQVAVEMINTQAIPGGYQ